MGRKLMLYRNTHATKNAVNFLRDKAKVRALVDGKPVCDLVPDRWVEIPLSDKEHVLKFSEPPILSLRRNRIPAGTGDYKGWFFNDGDATQSIDMVPCFDPFGDMVVSYLLEIFRSQELRDRIKSTYNSNHCVDVLVTPKGVEVRCYDRRRFVGYTKELITYRSMGMTYPDDPCDGYNGGLRERIGLAVNADEKLDIKYTGTGFYLV